MTSTGQCLAYLERLVAEQGAEIARLRQEAFVMRTLEEIRAAEAIGGYGPVVPARRAGHLRVVKVTR